MVDPDMQQQLRNASAGAAEPDSATDAEIEGGGEPADPLSGKADGELLEAALHQVAELTNSVNALTAERDDLKTMYSRLAADFDNYRRRTQREMEGLVETAAEGLITKLLPVVDNLERALQAAQATGGAQDGGLVQGVEMTLQQLMRVLTQAGVDPIAAQGLPFDPTRHEAIMQVEETTLPDQTVVEELQKGYLLKGKVVRPSMVKVSRR